MLLRDISKKLNSSLEARMLFKHVTGLSDVDLIGNDDIPLNDDQKNMMDDFVAQRLNGCPISKIIGYKEFYGRDFIVNDDVLDPRPDSETLIEVVLEWADKEKEIRILELGVGSGCLVLTLLSELPNATAVGADISPQAINVAKENAKKLSVENRIDFVESNWFESVEGEFDLIVSNPPYINSDVITELDKNVREYDPMLALDGGADGLDPYKVILPQLEKYLVTGGMIALEHGYDQCGRIEQMLMDEGLSQILAYRDLGGLDRVLTAIHK